VLRVSTVILVILMIALATGIFLRASVEIKAVSPAYLVNTIDTSIWDPPSPDPSALAYLTASNQLLVADSEVDASFLYYEGKNVFISDLYGNLISTHNNMVLYSTELTGAAQNPDNGHIFFSDDDRDKVFEVNPGLDGAFFTADDIVTNFSTTTFNCLDPEGLAYGQGKLIIANGNDNNTGGVYIVSPGADGIFNGAPPIGDDQVNSFSTSPLGVHDPEAVEYNPDHGTLFLVSSWTSDRTLWEVTLEGELVKMYDLSFLGPIPRSGMAYGPGGSEPGVNHVFVSSRGEDNAVDPYENDGKIFEIALDLPPHSTPGVTFTPTLTCTPTRTPTPISSKRLYIPIVVK
jgi:hypothetical protein